MQVSSLSKWQVQGLPFNISGMASPEPTSKEDIGARLELTREALDLSQAELCRITGIETTRWNNAETADNRIGIEDAAKLCRATGVTMDWIYRGVRQNLPAKVLEGLARIEAQRGRRRA